MPTLALAPAALVRRRSDDPPPAKRFPGRDRTRSRPRSRAGSGSRARGADGQVLPLVALVVAGLLGLVVLVAGLGGVVVDRARAKAAADASALAGALEGEPGAARVAAANGAVLEAYLPLPGRVVEVTVRLGRARATSRAEPDPDADP